MIAPGLDCMVVK